MFWECLVDQRVSAAYALAETAPMMAGRCGAFRCRPAGHQPRSRAVSDAALPPPAQTRNVSGGLMFPSRLCRRWFSCDAYCSQPRLRMKIAAPMVWTRRSLICKPTTDELRKRCEWGVSVAGGKVNPAEVHNLECGSRRLGPKASPTSAIESKECTPA